MIVLAIAAAAVGLGVLAGFVIDGWCIWYANRGSHNFARSARRRMA